MSTTSDYKKGKSNQVKVYMFRGSNYKRGDPNLAGGRSFLIGGRWPSFLPNFFDNHLPHLNLGPGGSSIRGSFLLGGQLRDARLDPLDTFRRGRCIFAKKDHRGNRRKLEGGAIIVPGLQTIFLLQKEQMESEKELSGVRRKTLD
jgi:hypothetical protein